MGYYSDVAMVANGDIDTLLTRFATERTDHFAHFAPLLDWEVGECEQGDVSPTRLTVNLSGERWYTEGALGSPWVNPVAKAVESLWGFIDEQWEDVEGCEAAFIRIGEDDGDVDRRVVNDGWDLLAVQRSIVFCDERDML